MPGEAAAVREYFLTEESWDYEVYPIDTPAAAFPLFEGVLNEWRAKCRDGRFPYWSELTPWDFQNRWSYVYAIDVDHAVPFDGKVAYCGTLLAQALGIDSTGLPVSRDHAMPYWESDYLCTSDIPFLEAVSAEPKIGMTSGPIHVHKNYRGRYSDIIVPLSSPSKLIARLLFLGHLEKDRGPA